MKKIIKRIVFALIVVSLVWAIAVVIKVGRFEKLEGYMYSLAAAVSDSATSSNATSSNATSSNATSSNATSSNATSSNATSSNATSSNATSSNATSSNATSSNATSSNATSSNATSSNATSSNATSSNATSSNATSNNTTTETIKVTNTQNNANIQNTQTNTNVKENVTTQDDVNTEESEEKIDLEYNNSEITQEILDKIYNGTDIQNIIINIDEKVNISKDIFDAAKGKDLNLKINAGENQIIFYGNNIIDSKDIDTQITYNLVSEETLLKEIVPEGIVINFANNGELPGTALIRIKLTDEMKQVLDLDTILVYHYDEQTNELTQLMNNATYSDEGFIEFTTNHNSKYLLVNGLIEEKEYTVTIQNSEEIKEKVSFLESYKMYIMIIGVSVLAIIVVIIILIVDKKIKGKVNEQLQK